MEPLEAFFDAEAPPAVFLDSYFDALDEFQPDRSLSTVAINLPDDSPEASSSTSSTLRRRHKSRRASLLWDPPSTTTQSVDICDKALRFRERRKQISSEYKKDETSDGQAASSGIDGEGIDRNVSLNAVMSEELGSRWLLYVAEFIIKIIRYQLTLLSIALLFPIRAIRSMCMLVMDPLSVARTCWDFYIRRLSSLWNNGVAEVSHLTGHWFRGHETTLKHLLRFGWGLFWSVNLGMIILGFFVFSVMLSGFSMRFLLDKPLKIDKDLNFDFSKHNPVAFMPVRPCSSIGCAGRCDAMDGGNALRLAAQFVPPKHKMKLLLRLILPESEYNRNIGNFQVRVELLSESGEVHHTMVNLFMLKYKSEPVRIFSTFLKILPIISGYVSESQTLDFKLQNLRIGQMAMSCIKVTLEQRAKFAPGAGIPEIYKATLLLQSDLSFLKSILWYWRRTIRVWITIGFFVVQMLFVLICCRNLFL